MLPRSNFVDPQWTPHPGAGDQSQTLYSDTRNGHQHSPSQGPAYPVAYPFNTPFQVHSSAQFASSETAPSPAGEDKHRSYRGMVVEDDRALHQAQQPSFPQGQLFPSYFPIHGGPYHPYPQPEYGKYYLAPGPEPFTDYAFAFDGFRHQQGQPQYHMQHMAQLVNNSPFPSVHSKYPIPNRMHPTFQSMQIPSNAGVEANHSMPQGAAFPINSSSRTFYHPSQQMLSPSAPHIYPVHRTDSNGNLPHRSNQSAQDVSPTPSNVYAVRQHPSPASPPQNLSVSVHGPGGPRQTRRVYSSSERSPLLEDFRTRRDKIWHLKDILGHVMEFSADQHGSRFIQLKLETATEDEKHAVFTEFYPSSADKLMRDVFGNYVIQKFFDLGTKAQKDALVGIVEAQASDLAVHIYGCRVVQKAIDCISEEQQTSIINQLEQDILNCIKDAHGNHVIQKIVEAVSPDRLSFLPFICENILELSTHPFGCRVLQRCLEHLPHEVIRPLIDAVHCHTLKLVQDQYGNYVIQFIIERGQSTDKSLVVSEICGNVVALSQHKYASNVCEKALSLSDSNTRHLLIEEILRAADADTERPILTMIKDQFANYVLQCALVVAEGEQREELYTQVKSLVAQLRKSTTTYNRPLVSIERLVEKYFRKRSSSRNATLLEKQ